MRDRSNKNTIINAQDWDHFDARTDCAILRQMHYVLCHLMPNAVPFYAKRALANPGVSRRSRAIYCQIRHFLSIVDRQAYIMLMPDLTSTLAPLVQDAFQRFGAALLWNQRRPEPGDAPDAASVVRLARKLAREGGAEAVAMAARMLDAVEAHHARSIPDQRPAGSRR